MRYLVHVGLDREVSLGRSVSAARARHREVRVDGVRCEAEILRSVERQALAAGVRGHRERVGAVGAGVDERRHFARDDRPVSRYAGLHFDALGMPRPRGNELLVALQHYLDRSACPQRERGADVFQNDLLLDAEAAAYGGLDHSHARQRKLIHTGDYPPRMERDLRASYHDEAVLLVHVRERHVRLGRRRVDVLNTVLVLEDVVGLLEGRIDVADLRIHMRRYVPAGVGYPARVGFVMDLRRFVVLRLARVEDGWQDLILDLHEIAGPLGQDRRLRGYGGDAVSDKAHLVVQHDRVVRRRLGMVLPGRREGYAGHVLVRKDAVDTRESGGLRDVDPLNPGVRVRAALDAPVKQALHHEVVCVSGASRQKAHTLGLGHAPPDRAVLAVAGLCPVRCRRRAPGCHCRDRLNGLHVAGAATEIAREALSNLLVRRSRVLIQERLGRDDHALHAVSALGRASPQKLELQRMRRGRIADTLDRRHRAAIDLSGKHDARRNRAAVQKNRRRAAAAAAASRLHSAVPEAPQRVYEHLTRPDRDQVVGSVHVEANVHRPVTHRCILRPLPAPWRPPQRPRSVGTPRSLCDRSWAIAPPRPACRPRRTLQSRSSSP